MVPLALLLPTWLVTVFVFGFPDWTGSPAGHDMFLHLAPWVFLGFTVSCLSEIVSVTVSISASQTVSALWVSVSQLLLKGLRFSRSLSPGPPGPARLGTALLA